jgi:hypothetical protein
VSHSYSETCGRNAGSMFYKKSSNPWKGNGRRVVMFFALYTTYGDDALRFGFETMGMRDGG